MPGTGLQIAGVPSQSDPLWRLGSHHLDEHSLVWSAFKSGPEIAPGTRLWLILILPLLRGEVPFKL